MQAASRRLQKKRTLSTMRQQTLLSRQRWIREIQQQIAANQVRMNEMLESLPSYTVQRDNSKIAYEKEHEIYKKKFKTKKQRIVDATAKFFPERMLALTGQAATTPTFYFGEKVRLRPLSDERYYDYRLNSVLRESYLMKSGMSNLKLAFFESEFQNILKTSSSDVVYLIQEYAPFAQVRTAFIFTPRNLYILPIHVKFFFSLGEYVPSKLAMISSQAPHYLHFYRQRDSDSHGKNEFYYKNTNSDWGARQDMINWMLSKHGHDFEFRVVFSLPRKAMLKG